VEKACRPSHGQREKGESERYGKKEGGAGGEATVEEKRTENVGDKGRKALTQIIELQGKKVVAKEREVSDNRTKRRKGKREDGRKDF